MQKKIVDTLLWAILVICAYACYGSINKAMAVPSITPPAEIPSEVKKEAERFCSMAGVIAMAASSQKKWPNPIPIIVDTSNPHLRQISQSAFVIGISASSAEEAYNTAVLNCHEFILQN